MALVRWEPTARELQPFRSLRAEVDRVFEEFLRGWSGGGGGWLEEGGSFVPKVDLREEGNQYVIKAELPGLSKDDIQISLGEDSMTLKGERKRGKEQKHGDHHYREASYGSFQRVIPFPDEIVAEKAKAELQDGVLTLTVPKSESSKRKRTTVEIE